MKLIKKCILCNKSGLFLHLQNGLCNSCKLNLDILNKNRKDLLHKIKNQSGYDDMKDNILKLEDTLIKLNKYYSLGISLESDPSKELDDLISKKDQLILVNNMQKEIDTINSNYSTYSTEDSLKNLKEKYLPQFIQFQKQGIEFTNVSIIDLKLFIEKSEKKLARKIKREEKAYNDTINYIAFDLETTGLNPYSCEILEIGAVKVINGRISDTFQSLVKPKNIISSHITKINNITNYMVKDQRPIEEVLPEFISFIEKYPLVAHNAEFDYSFICENYEKIYNKKFRRKKTCTMRLYRKVYKEENDEKPYSSTLESCIEYLLSPSDMDEYLESAHRALTDAIMVHEIYEKLK